MTPLEELDEAVRKFCARIAEDGPSTLSGWTLAYQESRIEDNGPQFEPITWRSSYSISPGLSPMAAIGLARYAARVIEEGTFGYDEGDDDEA